MSDKKHIISAGYHVPLDYLNDSQLFQLKSELRVQSKYAGEEGGLGYNQDNEEPIKMYKRTDEDFIVPRIFGVKRFASRFDYVDRTQKGTEIDVTFDSDEGLRERTNQPYVVSEMYNHLQDYHCGIMKSVTGTGKTIMSLALIEKLATTTLVMVHNTDLLKEWQKKIDEFLPDADVGVFWQDKQEYIGKDIVIGMKGTLHSRIDKLESSFLNWAGSIIVDEVHRLGARTYSDLMFKFPAQKRWGLSATPKRKDGLTEVITNHIGPIAVSNDEHTVNPEIYMIPTGVRLDKSMYQKGPNLIFESLRTDLLEVQQRNDLILNELKKAYNNDRKIIVLTDRRDHIDYLEKEVSENITQSVGQLVGGMTDKERKVTKKCDIILGTFSFAKEGLDIEDADTLFLASPHSNVEQPVGRIRREHEGKKKTLVVDFVDNLSITKKMAYKRKQFYKRENFDINDYVL